MNIELQSLAVRIQGANHLTVGSGLLFISKERKRAYVLTAAHVCDTDQYPLSVQCYPDPFCGATAQFCFFVTREDVIIHSNYRDIDEPQPWDAAVIRLPWQAWMSLRPSVCFTNPDNGMPVEGSIFVSNSPDTDLRSDIIYIGNGTVLSNVVQETHTMKTILMGDLRINDADRIQELEGMSGAILAAENQNQTLLVGMIISIPGVNGNLGRVNLVDLYAIRQLLESEGVAYTWVTQIPTVAYYSNPTHESVTINRNFVNRENELAVIDASLTKDGMIVLGGIGGIGKTSLAEHYAATYRRYERCNVIPCQNSIACGIASQLHLPGITRGVVDGAPEDDLSYSIRLINALYQEPSQTRLLILDDVDPEDAFLSEIEKLDQARIITSRYRHEKWVYPFLEVQPLPVENQKNLFEHYLGVRLSAQEEGEFLRISNIVEGHTLTLQLIALQCACSDMTLSEIRVELEQTGVYTENPDLFRYGKTHAERNMYGHIRAIWNLSRFSGDETRIMQGLCLFTSKGISTQLYKDWLELPNMNAINHLVNQGWIQKNRSADGHTSIALHMVVAEVVYHEMYLAHPLNLGCIFSNICSRANDRAVNFDEQQYWLETSFHMGKKMVPSLDAVCLLNQVSLHYEYFREFELAINALDRAKEDLDRLSISQNIYLGHTLNNYGVIYQSAENYSLSMKYFKQAAELYRSLGVDAEECYGYALFNIAKLQIFMDNYSEAFRIATKASNILEKSNYFRLGEVYDLFREYYEHLAFAKYKEGQILIRAKKMSAKSPGIIKISKQMKQYYAKALEWSSKAVAHLHQFNSGEPEKEIVALSNLAHIKAMYQQDSSAKEDIQKVLDFYLSSTGENSIQVGETYNKMCIIYEKTGDYSDACKYGEKAVQIFTDRLGADAPKTKIARENLDFATESARYQAKS